MKYCPLRNFTHGDPLECLGKNCSLAADGAGECLIQQALQLYVSDRRTKLAEEMPYTVRGVDAQHAFIEAMRKVRDRNEKNKIE